MVKKFLVLSSLCVFALLSMEPNNSHNSHNKQNSNNSKNKQRNLMPMAFYSHELTHFTSEQQEAIKELMQQNRLDIIAQLQKIFREYKKAKDDIEQRLKKAARKKYFTSLRRNRLERKRDEIENNWNARKRELLGC